MTVDARLGYRNSKDAEHKWTEYASSLEERTLDCYIEPRHKKAEYIYNCSSVPMFELGSLHHDFYLLNIRLPVHTEKEPWGEGTNDDLGRLADMWVVVSVSVGGGDGLAVCVAGGVRNYHFYPHLLIGREGGREGEMYIS